MPLFYNDPWAPNEWNLIYKSCPGAHMLQTPNLYALAICDFLGSWPSVAWRRLINESWEIHQCPLHPFFYAAWAIGEQVHCRCAESAWAIHSFYVTHRKLLEPWLYEPTAMVSPGSRPMQTQLDKNARWNWADRQQTPICWRNSGNWLLLGNYEIIFWKQARNSG